MPWVEDNAPRMAGKWVEDEDAAAPGSPAAIQSAMRTELGQDIPDTQGPTLDQLANEPVSPGPSRFTPPISGLDRFKQGVKDPYMAGAQLIANAVGGPNDTTTKSIGNRLETDEQHYQNSRAVSGSKGMDWMRVAGNAIGSLPVSYGLPMGAEKLLPALAMGAIQGGAVASLNPVTNTEKPFWNQKVGQAEAGALTGGAMSGLFNVAGKIISPNINPSVKFLRERGVTPTIGQIGGKTTSKIEETLTSVPGTGDFIKNAQRRAVHEFNMAAYNEVLTPIGEKYTGETGHAGVRAVGDKLSQAYDDLLPSVALKPDQELAVDLQRIAESKATMSDEAAKQFDAIIDAKVFSKLGPTGTLGGEPLKRIESVLNYEIGRFGRSPDPNHQMISDALSEVRTAVLSNLERTNPAQAERLSAINQGWSNLVRLERAAANTKDGVFTPEGLIAAVKASDNSVRKRATARGQAGPMQELATHGYNVLGKSYPDSGTPGRVLTSLAVAGAINPKLAIGGALAAAPYTSIGQKVVGPMMADRPEWAPALASAVKRGPLATALALLAMPNKPGPRTPYRD